MVSRETDMSKWQDGDEVHFDREYTVADGLTMDDAALAVFHIES